MALYIGSMPRKAPPSESIIVTSQVGLFDAPAPSSTSAPAPAPKIGSNLPEYSVGELSGMVKKTIETTFGLVRVRGEISDLKLHSSGHLYFTLKDESAILASVSWRGQVSKLSIKPEVGMEVICTGKLTTYGGQSKYQLVVEDMALAGMGAILKLLEERKKKLASEGLFDSARKKKLPFMPAVIGVVTSPTGAVIRDILHRLQDRFPCHVLIWPVAVQGDGAGDKIVSAIDGFSAMPAGGDVPRPDLIIVARGGGSIEDLMPFNDEVVVRAVARCTIPLISAVGHETDTTLIDFAADQRAPTPTAAAEMAVPVRADLIRDLGGKSLRLQSAMQSRMGNAWRYLDMMARVLGDPARAFDGLAQKLDDRGERLALALQNFISRAQNNFARVRGNLRHPREIVTISTQKLQSLNIRYEGAMQVMMTRLNHGVEKLAAALAYLSPKSIMGRGFALVHDSMGGLVTSSKPIKAGDALVIEFADGQRKVLAEKS